MDPIQNPEDDAATDESRIILTPADEDDAPIRVRSGSRREIEARIMPWGRMIQSNGVMEVFERGAFDHVDPRTVLLQGLEHDVSLGIGHDGRPTITRHPVGRGISGENREDGHYMTFRVANTPRGDEVLALAEDGITPGVSVEVRGVAGGERIEMRSGRRTRVVHRADLPGVSTTYMPAYGADPAGSIILSVRTAQGGAAGMEGATSTPEPVAAPVIDTAALASAVGSAVGDRIDTAIGNLAARTELPTALVEALEARLVTLEEETRARVEIIPGDQPSHPDDFNRGDWLQLVLRTLSGETVSAAELQARTAADLITADNLGVVPPAYMSELIGIIDPTRPFLNSTRRLQTPRSGMQLTVPVIATRPTVGVQAAEKDELASTATSITSTNFNPITVGGYGDISLQLLKRSDPSYLSMYVDLLAEAYAIMADDKAVDALLAAGGVHNGGTLVPGEGAQFGDAWANAAAVSRRLVPDTVWLSTAAVAAFIDARSDTTNAPLYGNLAANFTAAGGVGGTISGLRPIHVPALDDEAADIIVGPSRGFAWTEDGTYTLQVDVPAKAGRDVGIVGMIWFAPLYPTSFTKYALGS